MKRKILSILTILMLVLTSVATAVPAGPVLALNAPPAADAATPSTAVVPVGSVWAWGSKGATGLGTVQPADSNVPVQVTGSGFTAIAAGRLHALALRSDGTVWAWGLNSVGQLGDGTTDSSYVPVRVYGLLGYITAIAAGDQHSLALQSDGTVWAWGYNGLGQLGDGGANPQGTLTPVRVSGSTYGGLTGVTAIAAGYQHNLALKSNGTVWAWGDHSGGKLGIGTTVVPSYSPAQVTGLTDVKAIAAGERNSLAIKSDGTVWAWGDNFMTAGPTGVPVHVIGLAPGRAVATGKNHVLVSKADGNVWAWGSNVYGQLGNGSTTNSPIPVQVNGTISVGVAAGYAHSLALQSDGSVWAWGYNYYGQLGDGTTTNRNAPVQVKGLTGVTAVAATNFYSLALKVDPPPLTPVPTLTPVVGTAPITVTPAPVTQTPITIPTPITAPVTAPAPKTTLTTGTTPIPSTGLVPIAKPTPRAKPNPSGILVYASPERIAGPGSGGVFSLSVWVASGSQVISSGDLSFNFDAAALEMTSITPGNVFGIAPILVQNDYNNTTGTARLVAARGTGSAPPPPPPPPIPAAQVTDAAALLPAGGAAQGGDATALKPLGGSAEPVADTGAVTPDSPSAEAAAAEADRILAEIIAAADAEAARIMAALNTMANAAANAVSGVLGTPSPSTQSGSSNPSPVSPVADASAPAHHAAEAVSSTYHAAEAVPTGGAATGTGSAVPPPSGIAFGTQTGGGSAAGPPSGNAYFGSPETGYVASNSLATIKFKVKSTAKPGDYQVSVSKAGLADAKGQDIQIRLITGSTITIGGAMKMGDLTGDGVVNYRDLGVFAGAYGSSSAQNNFNNGADLNGDGVIDYRDLAIFGANYEK